MAPSQLPNAQPFYVRGVQNWAISQERQRHTQALFQVGEMVMFILLWKTEDFEAGLVDRCIRCSPVNDSLIARTSAVYEQPITYRCPVCFGTTYGEGVRAKIIRPAIITDSDEDERKSPRGVLHAESVVVESTEDFRSHTGDFLLRQDGSRWMLGAPARIMIRTGMQRPTQAESSIGYARIPASREDEASVAFIIPPGPAELAQLLAQPVGWPNMTDTDVLNGPLIPFEEYVPAVVPTPASDFGFDLGEAEPVSDANRRDFDFDLGGAMPNPDAHLRDSDFDDMGGA
jgi:hypothetical protein